MADLSFSQPARPNLAAPIAIAVLVLAAAGFLLFRLSPRETAQTSIPRVSVYASHLVFKSDSNVVGQDQAQDTLYALVTIRITDRLKLPLFLKDITATLTTADGAALPAISAIEQPDLPKVFATFPAVAKLAADQGAPPLLRETRINPSDSAEGYVLLEFPVTEADWNARLSASVLLDLYHQQPLTVLIPKQIATQPDATPTPNAAPQPALKRR